MYNMQNIFRHQKSKRSIEDQDDFPDDLDAHRNVRPLAVLGERRPFERSRSIFAAARANPNSIVIVVVLIIVTVIISIIIIW